MTKVWEVIIRDQSDFDAVLYDGLFANWGKAQEAMEEMVASYREDQDDEFKDSIVGTVIERELIV